MNTFLALPGCGCRTVAHALSIKSRAEVVTHLAAARDAADAGSLVAKCQVDYLSQRMEPCPSTNPTPVQLADRAAADLRNARKEMAR